VTSVSGEISHRRSAEVERIQGCLIEALSRGEKVSRGRRFHQPARDG
jgi:hypothetical protein